MRKLSDEHKALAYEGCGVGLVVAGFALLSLLGVGVVLAGVWVLWTIIRADTEAGT